MFNHSCLPNCLWYLIGDYLFIYVCSSNIKQGDELTISYCPLWISSINERTNQLRQYNITSCQCLLCLYDRSLINEYENELKKFYNIRALARQKTLSNSYLQQLKSQYELLTNKFQERPVGFINEFIDVESIQHENQKTFVERLLNVCRFSSLEISNPIFLFGKQMELLLNHFEHFYSSDLKQWDHLLEYLYEIYTFKCHSSSNDIQKTLKDHKQLFTNLFQTQTFFNLPLIINEKNSN
jgi:hypothetical protein